VAAAAQVSQATVSRALSGNETVNPVLARRVISASEKLGYTANVVARALRTQQTGTVGVVVPSLSNPFFIVAVETLEGVLAQSQRSLILCSARDSAAVEADHISLLLARMVDGLVVIPVSQAGSRRALKAAAKQVPVVQFDRFVSLTGTDFVGADNATGVRQMVEHVRALGSRTLAYVGAEPTNSSAAERLNSFRLLAAQGSSHLPRPEFLGTFSMQWGWEAGERLLTAGSLPDAVICGADVIAVGLLAVLREAHVEVPRDVNMVSYDDSPMASITSPMLTSIRQPVEPMAEEAIRLLDDGGKAGQRRPRKRIFAPTLVVRESSEAKLAFRSV